VLLSTPDSPWLVQSAVQLPTERSLPSTCKSILLRHFTRLKKPVPKILALGVIRNISLTTTSHSVKTRIQLDPATYNRGLFGGFRQVIANEGAGALLTGFGPTAAGYFLQGAFKFGGYELFKQQSINFLGYETASNNRTAVYLASSALAEFFADIALCPLEATRIRLVSEPTYANGLIGGFSKMLKNEGVGAFYAGFGPILFKQ
jgi:Mitochondrial carrier protein